MNLNNVKNTNETVCTFLNEKIKLCDEWRSGIQSEQS